jgi:putative toxin-antitoxin system antitoxin component (TIGR02293 family)
MGIHTHVKKTKKRAALLKHTAGEKTPGRVSHNEVITTANKWFRHSRTEVTKRLYAYVLKNKQATEGKAFAIHKAIMDGISISVVDALKNELNFNDNEMADVLGTSQSTLLRWRKSHKDLDIPASERLVRFARILEIATAVLDDKLRAWSWLKRPQFGLGGKVPIELMKSETGAREVENLLMRIEHGVLA